MQPGGCISGAACVTLGCMLPHHLKLCLQAAARGLRVRRRLHNARAAAQARDSDGDSDLDMDLDPSLTAFLQSLPTEAVLGPSMAAWPQQQRLRAIGAADVPQQERLENSGPLQALPAAGIPGSPLGPGLADAALQGHLQDTPQGAAGSADVGRVGPGPRQGLAGRAPGSRPEQGLRGLLPDAAGGRSPAWAAFDTGGWADRSSAVAAGGLQGISQRLNLSNLKSAAAAGGLHGVP